MKREQKPKSKINEHLMHLFGGLIISTMLITFIGFIYDLVTKLGSLFGIGGFILILFISNLIGWVFLRKLDKRIKENARPHMIHYNLGDLKKD